MLKLIEEHECKILASAMDEKYTIYLDDRTFSIESMPEEEGVLVRTTLKSPDESYVYPVEARMLHTVEGLDSRKAALFLMNYIDGYFEDYLTEMESTYLPIDWCEMEYEGVSFQMRGQISNVKVEKMADELLEAGVPYSGPNIIV